MTDAARPVALAVLRRVIEHGGYSNLTLRTALDRARLGARDRAFATELVYGTLRHRIAIDAELAAYLERPLGSTPASALAVLRLGVQQLRNLRVPAHAAVSESVAIAEPRYRGLVNAVLRRMADASPPEELLGDDDSISRASGLSSWAVGELRGVVGDAEVVEAALAFGRPARLTVRVNRRRIDDDAFAAALDVEGIRYERGEIADGSFVIAAGAPTDLPGLADGWFIVQDQASTLVADSVGARSGERVADLCAGPGGKSAVIAGGLGPQGGLVAGDVSLGRARLVAGGLRRLGLRASVVVHDARRPTLRSGSFDRVLVDAPCTGIGSSRRRPELLWRATGDERDRLATLQREIVHAAVDLVAPGGRLVYSVCTFPRSETDAVCDDLLASRSDVVPAMIDGPDGTTERLRLWPHRHGTDGMFVAAFTRTSEA